MRHLRLLGPLEVDGCDQSLGPRDRVVISALALRPDERVDAGVLTEALWGEHAPASAAKVLQGCVSRLRKALGSDAIETVSGGYRLRGDRLSVDSQQFEDLVLRAREHLATRAPERAIALLTKALGMWRGPPLGELEEWMPGRLEAVRLAQVRLAAEEDLLQARLDAGDHLGVAADGTVLTGQQPFRERRWALLALAQYRSGRQADALASIRTARRALGQELGLDPGSELVALEARILAQDAGLATDHDARLADRSCPWKGLEHYSDRDGETFFGRDADIEACLTRLAASPLLVVTGPSGSGKSSLVRAGLVPALRASGAAVEVFTPGADGALAMAAARHRAASEPVLVIDQLEEVFTQREAAYARPWLHELAAYAETSAPVVLVVRGDHLATLGTDPGLARLAERGLHLVAPLAADSLRRVIEGPAELAGLRLEPGLVDLLVRDAEGQAGALPLLSHALTEIWRRREGGLLTVEAYMAAGGINDAVAASAERLYAGLSEDEQPELRWLMLHLVSLSDSGPYRTPLSATLAAGLDPVRRRILDLLVRARLVTSRAGGYDIAHEALVRAWPRLRAWLDEDRSGQELRRHLTLTATGWDALGRPASELYRGARLAAVLEWLRLGHEPLDDTERDFVDASRAVGEEEVRRLEHDARRHRVQNRRLRGLVAVALALAAVTTVTGGVAVRRGHEASARQAAAAAAAAEAAHQSLVARSVALRTTDLGVAALLAVRAWRERPDVLAESALLSGITSEPGFLGYRFVAPYASHSAASVPGRNDILYTTGSAVYLLDPASGRTSASFAGAVPGSYRPSELRVSADGSRAVQLLTTTCSTRCRVLVVYDLETGQEIRAPASLPFTATDVAISDDGDVVAAVGSGGSRWDVATWDADSGRRLSRGHLGGRSVAFGPGGQLLVGSRKGQVLEVAPTSLRRIRTWTAPRGSTDGALAVVGHRLLAAGADGLVALDLARRRRSWMVGTGCAAIAVSASLGRAYCALESGAVEERDLANGQPTGRRFDADLAVGGLVVAAGPEGDELFVQGVDQPYYARWSLAGPGAGGQLLAQGPVSSGGFDPSGRLVLLRRGGRSRVVDRSGRTVLVLPVPGPATWLSADTVGVPGPDPVLVAVPGGRVTRLVVPHVVRLFPGTGGRGWAVSGDHHTVAVREFSLETGRRLGPHLPRLTEVTDARVVSDASRLLVTALSTSSGSEGGTWSTYGYDAVSGAYLGRGLDGMASVALLTGQDMLGAGETGKVGRYSGLFVHPDEDLTRAGTKPSSLQVSTDKHRAIVTTDDAAYVFDPDTGESLGSPVPLGGRPGATQAWLSPDGLALLTITGQGAVIWDLRPGQMAKALCSVAGRNPTDAEWTTQFGEAAPYAAPCPGYPSALDQVDPTQ